MLRTCCNASAYSCSDCFPSQGPLQLPKWYSRQTLYLPFSMLAVARFSLHVRRATFCLMKLSNSLTLATEVNGPKYSDPSFILVRVRNTLGNGSFFITM